MPNCVPRLKLGTYLQRKASRTCHHLKRTQKKFFSVFHPLRFDHFFSQCFTCHSVVHDALMLYAMLCVDAYYDLERTTFREKRISDMVSLFLSEKESRSSVLLGSWPNVILKNRRTTTP
jgi:hypothetical protein